MLRNSISRQPASLQVPQNTRHVRLLFLGCPILPVRIVPGGEFINPLFLLVIFRDLTVFRLGVGDVHVLGRRRTLPLRRRRIPLGLQVPLPMPV